MCISLRKLFEQLTNNTNSNFIINQKKLFKMITAKTGAWSVYANDYVSSFLIQDSHVTALFHCISPRSTYPDVTQHAQSLPKKYPDSEWDMLSYVW